MKLCLVNAIEQKHINVDNRGLAYGDGLFTTAKIIHGKVEHLTQHLERLAFGCKKLGISAPSTDTLEQQIISIANNYPLAVLKIIITACSGGRGYARSVSNSHDLIITVHDYPTHYDDTVHTGISLGISTQKIGINPMLGGIKHLNRLEQVLLRQELSTREEDDILVTNVNNNVVEATSANVFFYLKGKLYTPEITQSGVNGIMRQHILRHYPSIIVKPFSLEELTHVEAMFICNCIMGIMPISNYNGRKLSIELPLDVRNTIMKL
jgi:4-amino-4-deoxychorismate lyase